MSNHLVEPMEFFKIDKISDDVFAIGPNIILKFNVSLSKISGGKRYHFHKEYEYPSKAVPDMPTMVTVKRSFDYYLSIESMQKDQNGNKVFIRIGPSEYMIFKKGLEEAIAWFTDKRYEKLFAYDKGKLILMPPIPGFNIPNLPMQKYIEFLPIIIDRGMANADKEPGVRIILSDPGVYVDINLDRLMGLYYIISCFNMYQAALSIVNYIQRPDFGTNRYVMDSGHTMTMGGSRTGATGIEGRFVSPKDSPNNINTLEG